MHSTLVLAHTTKEKKIRLSMADVQQNRGHDCTEIVTTSTKYLLLKSSSFLSQSHVCRWGLLRRTELLNIMQI